MAFRAQTPAPAGAAGGEGEPAVEPLVEPPEALSRRTFQSYLAASLASFAGLVLGLPIVGYLAAPLAQRIEAAWVSLGRVESFTAGAPRLVSLSLGRVDGWRRTVEARTCWVRALGGGQFHVFNGRCTHLGCAYSWRTEGEHADRFFCPCHDGVFAPDGKVVGGPPPRPLDRLETRIEGGELLVLYQDFQQGIPQKQPL